MKYLNIITLCLLFYALYLLHTVNQKRETTPPPIALPALPSAQAIAAEVIKQMSIQPRFNFSLFRWAGAFNYVDLKLERYGGVATDISVVAPEGLSASCTPGGAGGPFLGGDEFVVHLAAASGESLPKQLTFGLQYSTAQSAHETKKFILALDTNGPVGQKAQVTPLP